MSRNVTIERDVTASGDGAPRPWTLWQRTPCPEWCVARHQDGDHPDDRACVGAGEEVELSMGEPVRMPLDGYALPVARLYLSRGYREISPRLEFCDGDSPSVDMTLDQAEDLAEKITRLVAEARRPGVRPLRAVRGEASA